MNKSIKFNSDMNIRSWVFGILCGYMISKLLEDAAFVHSLYIWSFQVSSENIRGKYILYLYCELMPFPLGMQIFDLIMVAMYCYCLLFVLWTPWKNINIFLCGKCMFVLCQDYKMKYHYHNCCAKYCFDFIIVVLK